MSDEWLKIINDKLQTIIDNQERQYALDKEWIAEHKADQQKKWDQISGNMPNLGNIDLSQIMNMAQRSFQEITDDKKNFDFGVVRRPARIYEDERMDEVKLDKDKEKEKEN